MGVNGSLFELREFRLDPRGGVPGVELSDVERDIVLFINLISVSIILLPSFSIIVTTRSEVYACILATWGPKLDRMAKQFDSKYLSRCRNNARSAVLNTHNIVISPRVTCKP